MKKIFIIIVITTLYSTNVFTNENISIPDNAITDFSQRGFRGLKWDDPISKHINDLSLYDKGKDIKLYNHKNEKLSIGSAKLTSLVYTFKNGHFSGVIFHTKDSSNKIAIVAELEKRFSKKGRKPSKDSRSMSWHSKRITAGIRCGRTDICQIYYTKK